MFVQILRFTLAPTLVAVATLAARKFGERVGGWITALPFVAGPLLFVLALEQGPRFAADSARSALFGLIALLVFAVAYAHLCVRLRWAHALPVSWAMYLAVAAALRPFDPPLGARLVATLVGLSVAFSLLPRAEVSSSANVSRPTWDLPVRMAAALLLVGSLATAANTLGPQWSGLLTPFPVATTILVTFTHAQDGPQAVARVMRGFIPALAGLAIFFAALCVVLPRFGVLTGFSVALASTLLCQAALLALGRLRSVTIRNA